MGRDYKKLVVWQKSYDLVLSLYKLLSSFPDSESLNLSSQARRSCTSIPLNIAEGASMRSNKSFLHFLNIAYASAKELEVVMLLSRDLNYLPFSCVGNFLLELDDVKGMLYSFMRSVEREVSGGKVNFSSLPRDYFF